MDRFLKADSPLYSFLGGEPMAPPGEPLKTMDQLYAERYGVERNQSRAPIFASDGSMDPSLTAALAGPVGQKWGYSEARDEGFIKEFGKGLVRGGVQAVQGIAETVRAKGTSADLQYFLRTNRQLFDSERKSVWSYIGNVGGAAIGQNAPYLLATAGTTAAVMRLAGGALKAAQAAGAAKAVIGAERAILGAKVLRGARISGMAATFITQHGNNLKELRERLPDMPDGTRATLATVVSAIQAWLEAGMGAGAAQTKAMAQFATGQLISKGGALSYLQNVVGKKAWGAISRLGSSVPGRILMTGIDETKEEVLQHLTQELAVAMFRPGGYDKNMGALVGELGQIVKESFIGGLFVGAIPATYNAIIDAEAKQKAESLTEDSTSKSDEMDKVVTPEGTLINEQARQATQNYLNSLFVAAGIQEGSKTPGADATRQLLRNFFVNLAYREWSTAKQEDRAKIRPENYFKDLTLVLTQNVEASKKLFAKIDAAVKTGGAVGGTAIIDAINEVSAEAGAIVNSVLEMAETAELNNTVMRTWRELARRFTGNQEAGFDEVLEAVGRTAGTHLTQTQQTWLDRLYKAQKARALIGPAEMSEILGDLSDPSNVDMLHAVAVGWIKGVGQGGRLSIQVVANENTGLVYGILHDAMSEKTDMNATKRALADTAGVKKASTESLAKARARVLYVGNIEIKIKAIDSNFAERQARTVEEVRQRQGEAAQRRVDVAERGKRKSAIEDALVAQDVEEAARTEAGKAQVEAEAAQKQKAEDELKRQQDAAALRSRDMVDEFRKRYGEGTPQEHYEKASKEQAGEAVETVHGSQPLSLNTLESLGDANVLQALGIEGGTIALELQRQFDEAWAKAPDDAARAEAVSEIYARARSFAPAIAPSSAVDPQMAATLKYMESKLRSAKGGRKLMARFETKQPGQEVTSKTVLGAYIGGPAARTTINDNLLMLFWGHDGATVMHELMHHMIDNNLLPNDVRKILYRNFVGVNVPEGEADILQGIPLSAQENICNALLAYILEGKTPEGGTEVAVAFAFLKSVIAQSAREVLIPVETDTGMKDENGKPVMAVNYVKYKKGSKADQKFLAKMWGQREQVMFKSPIDGKEIPLRLSDETKQLFEALLLEPPTKSKLEQMYGEALANGARMGYGAASVDPAFVRALREQAAGIMGVSEETVDARIIAAHGAEIMFNPRGYIDALTALAREHNIEFNEPAPEIKAEQMGEREGTPVFAALLDVLTKGGIIESPNSYEPGLVKLWHDALREVAGKAQVEVGDPLAFGMYRKLVEKTGDKQLVDGLLAGLPAQEYSPQMVLPQGPQMKMEYVSPTSEMTKDEFKGWVQKVDIVTAAVQGEDGKVYPSLPKKGTLKFMSHSQAMMLAVKKGVMAEALGALTSDGRFVSREVASLVKRQRAGAKWSSEMAGMGADFEVGSPEWLAMVDSVYETDGGSQAVERALAMRTEMEGESASGLDRKGLMGRIWGSYTEGEGADARAAAEAAIAADVRRFFGDVTRPGHKTGLSGLTDDQLAILADYRGEQVGRRLSAVRRLPKETAALASEITPETARDLGRRANETIASKLANGSMNVLARFIGNTSHLQGLAEIFARNNPDSMWIKWFRRTYDQAINNAKLVIEEANKKMRGEIAAKDIQIEDFAEKVLVKDASGVERVYTASQALEVWVRSNGGTLTTAMRVGKDGVERMTQIGKLLAANPIKSKNGFDASTIAGLIEFMRTRPKLQAFAEITQKYSNESFARAAEAYFKATGKRVSPISDWYTPGKYEEKHYDPDDPAIQFLNWERASANGITTERDAFSHRGKAPGEAANVDYVSKILKHIVDMNKYSQMAVPINTLLIVAESQEIGNAIQQQFGDKLLQDKMVKLLKRVMSPYDHMRTKTPGDSVIDGVINNVTTSALCFNLMPIFTQQATWGPAIAALGARSIPRMRDNFSRTFTEFVAKRSIIETDLYKFAYSKAPSVVTELWKSEESEWLDELTRDVGVGELRFKNRTLVHQQQVGMRLMGGSDMVLRLATFKTAYDMRLDELKSRTGEYSAQEMDRRAVEWGLEVIRDSHNPSTAADRGLIQSEGQSMLRGLMRFQAQPFANMNMFLRKMVLPTLWAYQKSGIIGAGKQLLLDKGNMRRIAFGMMLPGVVLGAVARRRPQKDFEEFWHDAILMGIANLVPIWGQCMWLSAVGGWGDKAGAMDLFTGWANDVTSMVTGAMKGDWDGFKTINGGIRFVEGLTGIPHYPIRVARDALKQITVKGGPHDGSDLADIVLGKRTP